MEICKYENEWFFNAKSKWHHLGPDISAQLSVDRKRH